jgi:hypothetical protein
MFARTESAAAAAWDAIDRVFSEEGVAHALQAMKEQRGESAANQR